MVSKRITSAPSCASVSPPSGAATNAEPSTTRKPSSIPIGDETAGSEFALHRRFGGHAHKNSISFDGLVNRRRGTQMASPRQAAPIKVGILNDMVLPDDLAMDVRGDMRQPFELVFDDAVTEGVLDRPVELVYREVDGLPRGTVKAVIDAYGELVDEGCLGGVRSEHLREHHPGAARRSNGGSGCLRSACAAPMSGSGSGPSRSRTAP